MARAEMLVVLPGQPILEQISDTSRCGQGKEAKMASIQKVVRRSHLGAKKAQTTPRLVGRATTHEMRNGARPSEKTWWPSMNDVGYAGDKHWGTARLSAC